MHYTSLAMATNRRNISPQWLYGREWCAMPRTTILLLKVSKNALYGLLTLQGLVAIIGQGTPGDCPNSRITTYCTMQQVVIESRVNDPLNFGAIHLA